MNARIASLWKFLSYDIWRVTEDEVTRRTFSVYTIIKTIFLCLNRFTKDRLTEKASALTYSTLLAIVPILAILFAIARGFGFSNLIERIVSDSWGGQNDTWRVISQFADSYLAQAQSGVFIGVGLVLLLWTVINLIINIETTFNSIWQVKKARSIYRMITDYFSMLLLLPILLVVSSGLSIFMTTMLKHIEDFALLAPMVRFLIRLSPFVLAWGMFTGLYMFMPNTNVRLKYALIAGVLAGTAHQTFQFLYISGQIWVSRYNAIYGSFAALPLFLLWLQVSWTICLFGVQLTYAGQNIRNFSFDKDTQNISRRFRDFIAILIMSAIAKRFADNRSPYTAEELSVDHHVPIRLVHQTLEHLETVKLVHEVMTDEKSEDIGYQPSMDIGKLSVGILLDRLDTYGSEDFKMDTAEEFGEQWKVLLEAKEEYYKSAGHVLLKDL
ncbi:MAG: YihY/virulence factor BrkB family protein [Prevotellaceae bacterium]|jgi:membrane protein|nr:YihY/virulence factor BrkB family protein [Prevotellaceae bacterium]